MWHVISARMISVVIPTLNAEARLPFCLDALVASAVDGLVKEVIVVDGGSTDATLKIADGFGARIINAEPGRGGQLKKGAEEARGDWLFFLHGDTVMSEDWGDAARAFIQEGGRQAGVFTLSFDAPGALPRLVAMGAMARTRLFKNPYGDQGLLISRSFYEEIGGYQPMPLFEDVEIIERIIKVRGRSALKVLRAKAVTSADRYERNGYLKQAGGNLWLLMRYYAGVTPEALAKAYR